MGSAANWGGLTVSESFDESCSMPKGVAMYILYILHMSIQFDYTGSER